MSVQANATMNNNMLSKAAATLAQHPDRKTRLDALRHEDLHGFGERDSRAGSVPLGWDCPRPGDSLLHRAPENRGPAGRGSHDLDRVRRSARCISVGLMGASAHPMAAGRGYGSPLFVLAGP